MEQVTSDPRTREPGRLAALDGLRGVAAVVVLLHHTFLLNPFWPGGPTAKPAPTGSWLWWLNYTPLKPFTAGWESVMLFFVLSGVVLTLPVLGRRGFDWIAYYPRRIVRLMLPVFGSVLLAAMLVMAIPQISTQPAKSWFSRSSTPNFGWGDIVQAFDVLGGDGQINNPLWSLRWELLFSLLLPVFVALAVLLRRWWIGCFAGVGVVVWLGVYSGSGAATYLPVFFLGALLATRLDDLQRGIASINAGRMRHLVWAGLFGFAVLMMVASWLTSPLLQGAREVTNVLRALAPLAAVLLVICAMGWSPLRRALGWAPTQALGKISFSLYLVHVPVLIFTVYLLSGAPLAVAQVVGALLSVVVATGFWWLLESRSNAIGKRFGAWVSRRVPQLHAVEPSVSTVRPASPVQEPARESESAR